MEEEGSDSRQSSSKKAKIEQTEPSMEEQPKQDMDEEPVVLTSLLYLYQVQSVGDLFLFLVQSRLLCRSSSRTLFAASIQPVAPDSATGSQPTESSPGCPSSSSTSSTSALSSSSIYSKSRSAYLTFEQFTLDQQSNEHAPDCWSADTLDSFRCKVPGDVVMKALQLLSQGYIRKASLFLQGAFFFPSSSSSSSSSTSTTSTTSSQAMPLSLFPFDTASLTDFFTSTLSSSDLKQTLSSWLAEWFLEEMAVSPAFTASSPFFARFLSMQTPSLFPPSYYPPAFSSPSHTGRNESPVSFMHAALHDTMARASLSLRMDKLSANPVPSSPLSSSSSSSSTTLSVVDLVACLDVPTVTPFALVPLPRLFAELFHPAVGKECSTYRCNNAVRCKTLFVFFGQIASNFDRWVVSFTGPLHISPHVISFLSLLFFYCFVVYVLDFHRWFRLSFMRCHALWRYRSTRSQHSKCKSRRRSTSLLEDTHYQL